MLLYIDVDLERNVSCFADIAYPTSSFKFQLLVIKIVTFMSVKFLSDTRHIFLTCRPPIHIPEYRLIWLGKDQQSYQIRDQDQQSYHFRDQLSYHFNVSWRDAVIHTQSESYRYKNYLYLILYSVFDPICGRSKFQRRDFKVPNSAKWSKA
jgi:hypothetical protein